MPVSKRPTKQPKNRVAQNRKATATLKLNRGIVYGGFFTIALLLRLIYVFTIDHLPTFNAPMMDGNYHHETAVLIAAGDWLGGDKPYYRSPFYIYLLAVIYKIFGVGFLAPRLVGAVIGAVTVVLIVRVAEKLFGARAALFSGFIAVFCWPMIFFDAELLGASLTMMVGLILLLLFLRAYEQPTRRNMIILGLFFGFTAITRENYLPIIPLAALFFVVVQRRLLPSLLFIAAAVITISPITIRNYVVLDDFIPITHYTGVNFYIGNNSNADGRTAIIPFSPGSWHGGVEYANQKAQEHYKRPIKPSDVSVYWTQETLKYIGENFNHFLGNVMKKFFFIFDLYEYSNNKEMYFFRDQSALLGIPIFVLFSGWLFVPLGLMGIFFCLTGRNRQVWPLYVILVGYVIGLSLGFVNSRIRMPVVVLLIIFAGFALTKLLTERKMWAPRVAALAVIILLLLAVNKRPDGHFERSHLAGHFILANAYLSKGELEAAEENYLESIQLTRGEYSQISRNSLANIEFQRAMRHIQANNWNDAKQYLEKSLDYEKTFPAQLNLAHAVLNIGEEDALPHYLQAVALAPDEPYAYIEIARYYQVVNNREEARRYLALAEEKAAATTVDPEFSSYLNQHVLGIRAWLDGKIPPDGGNTVQ